MGEKSDVMFKGIFNMMSKICQAIQYIAVDRPDMAKPILEELKTYFETTGYLTDNRRKKLIEISNKLLELC